MPSSNDANDLSQVLKNITDSLDDVQVADAGASDVPIGQVEVLGGDVEVIHADGTKVILSVGDSVYEGDTLETGSNGSIGIVFSDGGSFSLGENGRMVLDEMTFDASSQSGEAVLSIVEGVFSYVSGQIAKFSPDAMVIETPSANIGIRGTAFAGNVDADGRLTAALMEENGGFTGELIFTNSAGVQIVNQPGFAVNVASETVAPSRPFAMSVQEIGREFGGAIHSLPGLSTHLPSEVRDAVDEAASPSGVDEVFDNSALEDDPQGEIQEDDSVEEPEVVLEPSELQPNVVPREVLNPVNHQPFHIVDRIDLPPIEPIVLRHAVERIIDQRADDAPPPPIEVFEQVIVGTAGNDILNGSELDTKFIMEQGSSLGGTDVLNGGTGVDEIHLTNLDSFELVYDASGVPPRADYTGNVSGSIDLTSVEQLYADDGITGRVHLTFGPDDTGFGYIVAGSALNDTLSTSSGSTLLSGGHTITSAATLGSLIFGKGGDDTITGSSSGDEIFGGTGNDVLNGGDNINGDPDVLWGESGDDTLVINYNSAIVGGGRYLGGAGNDTLQLLSADVYDLTTITIGSIENLAIDGVGSTIQAGNWFLNSLSSIFSSTAATGVILEAVAQGGNILDMSNVAMDNGLVSFLTFRAGDVDSGVTILDNTSDAEGRALIGGSGQDQLSGFGGADFLIGEGGADILTGGAGGDMFKYTAASNGGATVEQADTITDFTAGQDSILLEAAGFGSISTMTSGYNYTEIVWSGADKAALNVALQDGTIEALMQAGGIAANIDSIAFLSFTDNSGGEDTAQYLLYDNDVSAGDGVTVLADMNGVTAAAIAETDFAIG